MDPLSLKPLIDSLGPHGLLRLLERDGVSGFYAEDMCMTQNYRVSQTQQLHSFDTGAIASSVNDKRIRQGRRGRLEGLLESGVFSRGDAVKFVDRFSRSVTIRRLSSDFFIAGGVHRAATRDLLDQPYITEAARRVVANVPGFEPFAPNLRFDIIQIDETRFAVQTNINFEVGNARRRQQFPGIEDLSESNILSAIFDARVDLILAAHYGSDFHTSAVNSGIVRLRNADLLRHTGISEASLLQLHDMALDGYPSVAEAINSGQRSFDEFLKILDRSEKFRDWLHQMGPDADVVREYIRKIGGEHWISSLPAKVARYVIAGAVGLHHPIAGLALSAADMFLLERMFQGWRPNHFMDGELKRFLHPQDGNG